MMHFDRLEPVIDKGTIRVVIETPRGSRHKYAYQPEVGFVLRKSLPEGMVFPFDFGFIPLTKGEDGDPLDVLVLADEPLFPGCVVACRLIGLIKAKEIQGKQTVRNDRFVAVAQASLEYEDIHQLADLPPRILKQTEQFFISYNQMEGKTFKVMAVDEGKAARKKFEGSRD
jgi:inorganic pyrophosphatase